jgi:hypothetical protein
MAAELEGRSYRWVLPLVVGIFCGGLGGAVFTWYVNRPKSTVVTYTIASTTIAAPESVTGLIPDLKVLIGSDRVQSLYTYNIELLPREGPYLDKAEVAVEFPPEEFTVSGQSTVEDSPLHIYGSKFEAPSATNHFDCKQTKAGFLCTIYPLDTTHPRKYRIIAATDQSQPPILTTAAKGVDLVPAEQFGTGRPPAWRLALDVVAGLLVGVGLAELPSRLGQRRARLRRERLKPQP